MSVTFPLVRGWHLCRIEINGIPEWIVCDPDGNRLDDTRKHKQDLDWALINSTLIEYTDR